MGDEALTGFSTETIPDWQFRFVPDSKLVAGDFDEIDKIGARYGNISMSDSEQEGFYRSLLKDHSRLLFKFWLEVHGRTAR